MKILNNLVILMVKIYQLIISPWLPPTCRYTPTCSQYAIQAFQSFPFLKAIKLTVRRLLSCRPGGGHGYDPLPESGKIN